MHVFLLLYVDDMVIIGFDQASIQEIRQLLQASFHMKDLVSKFLTILMLHTT